MPSDPFEILGLSSQATESEIRRAYLHLAQEVHPDLHPGAAMADADFKRLRRAYDRALANCRSDRSTAEPRPAKSTGLARTAGRWDGAAPLDWARRSERLTARRWAAFAGLALSLAMGTAWAVHRDLASLPERFQTLPHSQSEPHLSNNSSSHIPSAVPDFDDTSSIVPLPKIEHAGPLVSGPLVPTPLDENIARARGPAGLEPTRSGRADRRRPWERLGRVGPSLGPGAEMAGEPSARWSIPVPAEGGATLTGNYRWQTGRDPVSSSWWRAPYRSARATWQSPLPPSMLHLPTRQNFPPVVPGWQGPAASTIGVFSGVPQVPPPGTPPRPTAPAWVQPLLPDGMPTP